MRSIGAGCCSAQVRSLSSAGQRDCPQSVRWYSTFGGTSACTSPRDDAVPLQAAEAVGSASSARCPESRARGQRSAASCRQRDGTGFADRVASDLSKPLILCDLLGLAHGTMDDSATGSSARHHCGFIVVSSHVCNSERAVGETRVGRCSSDRYGRRCRHLLGARRMEG